MSTSFRSLDGRIPPSLAEVDNIAAERRLRKTSDNQADALDTTALRLGIALPLTGFERASLAQRKVA